jgi:hypothetical protein
MKDKYRVVIVAPEGYRHALCFTEVAFLLKNSLCGLGHDCEMGINEFAKDRTNIVVGYHLLRYGDHLLSCRYIPYQLEQLSTAEGVFSDNVKALLATASEVWDYSPENIAFLKAAGITAKHLPVGYHQSLEQVPGSLQKDIDVLFYGSVTERRKAVLDELERMGAKVKVLFGVYGKERDACIGRSRIVLNIHFYDAKIFEAVRVSYLLNNRCCIVSEESPQYPYAGVNIPLVPHEKLVARCMELLNYGDGLMRRLADENYREFKQKFAMTDLIKNVM